MKKNNKNEVQVVKAKKKFWTPKCTEVAVTFGVVALTSFTGGALSVFGAKAAGGLCNAISNKKSK